MLKDWLAEAHHVQSYKEVIAIGQRATYYSDLEVDVYRVLTKPLDNHQRQLLGMIVSGLYHEGRLDHLDVEYFGFGSVEMQLEGREFKKDTVLTRSENTRVKGCEFHGGFVGEKSKSVYVEESEFHGENAFRRSKDAVITNSQTLGDDFGRNARNMIFADSVSRGYHDLSHIRGIKVVNAELHGERSFCSSEAIAAFCKYIGCIMNPKNGVIVADVIGHAVSNFNGFSPEDTKIFAVTYKDSLGLHETDKPHPIIKIDESDIEGEWTPDNLEDKLRHICAKHDVEIPKFLKEKKS